MTAMLDRAARGAHGPPECWWAIEDSRRLGGRHEPRPEAVASALRGAECSR